MTPVWEESQPFSFAGQASDQPAEKRKRRKTRYKAISFKGALALLICFLIGIAAAILLLYTLL
jgi:hypothetical protein